MSPRGSPPATSRLPTTQDRQAPLRLDDTPLSYNWTTAKERLLERMKWMDRRPLEALADIRLP